MFKTVVDKCLSDSIKIHLQALDHYCNGEPELRTLSRICQAERTSVDVGANIGVYTYFLRRYTARVHAYEPNPELARRLQRLFSDVVVHNAACSDRIGVLTLRIPVQGGRPQHELASVSQDFTNVADVLSYDVSTVTIDSENLTDVGFIKIDVEQHERQVLRGALKTIEKWRPRIMTEVTPLLYDRALPEEFKFLTAQDYSGWFRFDKKYHPFAQFRPELHANSATWGKSSMGTNVFFFPTEERITLN